MLAKRLKIRLPDAEAFLEAVETHLAEVVKQLPEPDVLPSPNTSAKVDCFQIPGRCVVSGPDRSLFRARTASGASEPEADDQASEQDQADDHVAEQIRGVRLAPALRFLQEVPAVAAAAVQSVPDAE